MAKMIKLSKKKKKEMEYEQIFKRTKKFMVFEYDRERLRECRCKSSAVGLGKRILQLAVTASVLLIEKVNES